MAERQIPLDEEQNEAFERAREQIQRDVDDGLVEAECWGGSVQYGEAVRVMAEAYEGELDIGDEDEEGGDEAELVTDSGTPVCGIRSCDEPGTETLTDDRYRMKTRCPYHARVWRLKQLDGIGETKAERVAEEYDGWEQLVEEAVHVVSQSGGSNTLVRVAHLDGFSFSSSADLAEQVAKEYGDSDE